MLDAKKHISDDELLLFSEGETSPRRAAVVREHLEACSPCHERLKDLQRIAADAFRAYHDEFDRELPSASGPRAALRAQLQELSARSTRSSWLTGIPQTVERRRWACVCILLLLTAVGLRALDRQIKESRPDSASELASGPLIPNASLTPGAARAISVGQVCTLESPAETVPIPSRVREMVFHEYGMDGVPTRNYEVDHLITPALGGTDDISNLWPEPYASTEWNAHVKDQLEDRLHELVCEGKLDLPTAQHDIASNWISAYQKYFHTDRPLPSTSQLIKPRAARLRGADVDI